jgi:hypothetical protein
MKLDTWGKKATAIVAIIALIGLIGTKLNLNWPKNAYMSDVAAAQEPLKKKNDAQDREQAKIATELYNIQKRAIRRELRAVQKEMEGMDSVPDRLIDDEADLISDLEYYNEELKKINPPR